MAEYDGSIRIKTDIDSKNASAQLMSLENRIAKTADKVTSLRSKMDSLKNAQIPTQAYTEVQNQIAETEKKLTALHERQERFLETGGKTRSSAYQKIQYDIEQMKNTLSHAKSELQDLVDTGQAFTLGSETQKYASLGQQLGYAESELAVLNQRHDELIAKQNITASGYCRIGSVAKNAFKSIGGFLKSAVSDVLSFGKTLKNIAQRIFPSLNSSVKKSGGMFGSGFKNILKYGLGIRSLYVLFNKLKTVITEGFKNLYNSSEKFKNSVDGLKASATTLKNSFAAAFAPIVEIAIPYIQKLMDYISQLLENVAQFTASITGQKKYTKAIKQTANAYKDAEDAADGYLSPLDEIHKYQTSDKADTETTGVMFEEVPISSQFENISEWFKSMWEKADFTELGNLLGGKFKNALDSIPWDEIKEKAKKIGNSIATFLNGAIETPELFNSIGATIGEAINTGVAGAKEFFETTEFMATGQAIADMMNEEMETVEWDELAETISLGIEGSLETAIGFLDEYDWELLADSISEFFANIDWSGIFGRLGLLILELFRGVFTTGNKLGVNITSGLADYFRGIGWDSVAGFFEGLSESITKYGDNVKAGFQIIIDWAKEKLGIHSLSTVFAEIGKYCIEGLINGITSLVNNVAEIWNSMKKTALEIWKSVKVSISNTIQNIKNYITTSLNAIKATWITIWTSLKTTVVNIFNGIWISIKGVINNILSGIERMANGVINGVNSVIGALNGLKFTIPATPFSDEMSIGLNIPTLRNISIPKLATGTVVPPNREFMAVLGDNKKEPEVVSPLSTMRQALREELQALGITSGSNQTLVIKLYLDGKQISEAVVKEGKLQQMSTGKNMFLLGGTS